MENFIVYRLFLKGRRLGLQPTVSLEFASKLVNLIDTNAAPFMEFFCGRAVCVNILYIPAFGGVRLLSQPRGGC